MTNRIKSAFSPIHAEDALRTSTLQYVNNKMLDSTQPRRYHHFRRWAAVMAACFVLVLFSGAFTYNLYYTEAAYIDFDINPSLALTINRFDYVIGVEAYNEDAEVLLSHLNLQHKKVAVAMDKLIGATAETGVLQQSGLVSVTVQSVSGDDKALLASIQTHAEASVSHYAAAEVDVFSVDSDIRNAAHVHHISPAKYLAILELQEIDITATIDRCSRHSIREIRQMTQELGGEHHGESEETRNPCDKDTDSGSDNYENPERGHHGRWHE